jgi:hypothetical protein
MRILTFTLLCTLLLFPVLSKAQFGYGKVSEIEALQSRKLIVIIEQPSDKVLKKLNKKNQPDKIALYDSAISNYNANMKRVVEKFWTFSKNGIEYKTFADADALRKSGNKDYAVLYCVSAEMSGFTSGFDESSRLDWTWDITDPSKDRDYFDEFAEMKVSTLEDLKSKPIFYVVLTDNFPTITSLVNGLCMMQNYMDLRLRKKVDKENISGKEQMNEWVAKNNKLLKSKTLLIRSDFLPKDYDKYKVAETYPYKFEIVSGSRLDSAVFNQDEKYVYAVVMPNVNGGERTNQVIYIQAIFNGGNGDMCAYSMPSMGGMMLAGEFGTHNVGHKYIDSKTLDDFINPK